MNFCRSAATSIYTSSIQLMKCMYECIKTTCKLIIIPFRWLGAGIKKIYTILRYPCDYILLHESAIIYGYYDLPPYLKNQFLIACGWLIHTTLQLYLYNYIAKTTILINSDAVLFCMFPITIKIFGGILYTGIGRIIMLSPEVKNERILSQMIYVNVFLTYETMFSALLCSVIYNCQKYF